MQHAGAELGSYRCEPRRAWLDDLTRDGVRVDEHGAVGREPPRHLTLAAADSPGQPDPEHRFAKFRLSALAAGELLPQRRERLVGRERAAVLTLTPAVA